MRAQFNCYLDAGSFFYLPVKIKAKAATTGSLTDSRMATLIVGLLTCKV